MISEVNDIIRYYKGIRPCKIIIKGLKQDVLIQYLDDNTLDRTQIRLCHKKQKEVNKMPKPTTKTDKPKVVKENKPKIKESKSELFLRLAKVRTQKVLKALRILGNCSNRGNYEYSSEQIESIGLALTNALNETIAKFTPSKQEQESFEF